MNSQAITALAAEMNVSVADLTCLAQSVANSIEQDKAAPAFMGSDKDGQRMFVEAYVVHAVRKFEQFAATYRTNAAARNSFQMSVLASLQA